MIYNLALNFGPRWIQSTRNSPTFINYFSTNISQICKTMANTVRLQKDHNELIPLVTRSLQSGNVIGLPTDTIYGVACLAQSTEAIEKLYELKGRSSSKPVAICVSHVEDVKKWASVTVDNKLLSALLPGPVTLIFPRTALLNIQLNPDTQSVGIRIPDHPFVRDLVSSLKEPLAMTSANLSNKSNSLTIDDFKDIHDDLDMIIDGGAIGNWDTNESRLGSTVIDLCIPGSFRVIRSGVGFQSVLNTLLQNGLTEQRQL